MEKKYLTMKEVTEFLTLSRGKVNTMVKENEIPHYRIGRRILFDKQEIIEWVESRKVKKGKNA